MDGDGWVMYYKNGWAEIGVCGSKNVCESFLSYAQTIGLTNTKTKKHKESNCYKVSIRGYTASEIICCLYDNAQTCLNRKKIQFELTKTAYQQRGRRKGKLTDCEVKDIRIRHKSHQSINSIAQTYHVSWNVIDRILKHQTYRHTLR